MQRLFHTMTLAAWWCGVTCGFAQEIPPVGPTADGGHVVATAQLVRPAGQTLEIAGRPVDLAVAPDGKTVYIKDNRGLVAIDAAAWTVRQELGLEKDGGSMFGIAVARDGRQVYVSTAKNTLARADVQADGKLRWGRKLTLPGPGGKGVSFPCGIALSADEQTAYVCLSRNNTLGIVNLAANPSTVPASSSAPSAVSAEKAAVSEIEVGVAPYAVCLSKDGRFAYVTNWGGRRAKAGEPTADSSGTPAVVDQRGIAASGTVSIVDLAQAKTVAEIEVGLSPCALALSLDGRTLYVASANSDRVAFIDLEKQAVRNSLTVRPDLNLPFGSMPNGLAVSPDGRALYVSLAGNNALAVVRLDERGEQPAAAPPESPSRHSGIDGFIPTGWYPGAVAVRDETIYVANIKGIGSRTPHKDQKGWNSHWHRGTVSRVPVPDDATLRKYSEDARQQARIPQLLTGLVLSEKRDETKPVPVPARPGEPSVFEHVLYIIKENRTYDQIFGDMPKGNNDASLCVFGREVTPNHHAIAEQFVLLDNFYCNGVLSADGHSWATEGNVTPYLERAFGGFNRSYTFGDDPLTYSSSGFIWDHVLGRGYSFRNYGEFDHAGLEPAARYNDVLKDWQEKTGKIKRKQKIGVETMRRYACPDYPGWNLQIPDLLRADVFIKELGEFEQSGLMPNFSILYLPDDHTSGTGEDEPTPRAMVADNDLSLGRIVEAVSHSRFWPTTCIFVIEDDPQNGFDHVDGHRSLCLVISPYTKRGAVVSDFYNQASVFHTIVQMFDCVPQNQLYALAPLMSTCFTEQIDLTPYQCRPNQVPLGEMNKKASALPERERALALASAALPLDKPDQADEDTLNRILWHSVKGIDAPYPAELAGAHGKGLAALGLRLARDNGPVEADDDDPDDD